MNKKTVKRSPLTKLSLVAKSEGMCKYLGAGVYWDAGTDNTDSKQQTYQTPSGKTCHAGLWVMKKAYIGSEVTGTYYATSTLGRPADINKYFFLPAAGLYSSGYFDGAGSLGYYWSSSPYADDYAYYLSFNFNLARVYSGRYYGYLPMVAE